LLEQSSSSQIGREVAIPARLQDGDEFNIPLAQLIDCGRQLFIAKFTVQEGAGRPMSKGTGAAISMATASCWHKVSGNGALMRAELSYGFTTLTLRACRASLS
jgi:hypothetical protein